MAVQWSDAIKALRTKNCRYCSGQDRPDDAFCEMVKRSANEKIVFRKCMEIAGFGSCHWWPQRMESTLGEETEAVQPVRSVDFKTEVVGNPTRVRVVRTLAMATSGISCPTLPLSLMQQLRGGESAWPGSKENLSVCRGLCSG
jgi:hypothetical protein